MSEKAKQGMLNALSRGQQAFKAQNWPMLELAARSYFYHAGVSNKDYEEAQIEWENVVLR